MSDSKIAKVIICNSILICFSALLLSNNGGDNLKLWSADTKLTWKDFRDTVFSHSHRAAWTFSGFKLVTTSSTANAITLNVYSQMNCDKSWVDTTKKSDRLLSHEQYHFNVTEYWCRKLKKDLSSAKFTTKNFNEKLQSISKEDNSKLHDMQEEYDKDTNHSMIADQQTKWEKRIDELLKSTEKYADANLTLAIK